ncbi:glycoside hydrolase family 88 protein [Paenibacillus sp. BC26]|uniref:glycoside hydrolase family 88 protein n=1 Tax=Paenibacillus sp. BC26 TaxID=1881032 RepID=UPI002109A7DB|nr:glycoside hydrolase family 88 protein [Paenibacillus sp. BC26]
MRNHVAIEELGIDRAFIEEAIQYVLSQIDRNMLTFTDTFPSPASVDHRYEEWENIEWTPGFWTGMLWLAYEVTGDAKYRLAAEHQLESYKIRLEERIQTDMHDLGFLYTLSCVSAYKLTCNEEAKRLAIQAADLLLERYWDQAGIIQAWGNLNNPDERGRMIIDCCMNLPLLYWASEVTGDERYYKAADSHVRQSAAYLIRDDDSSYHTFYMDVETGEPRYGKTAQGFSDESCWSRGQAWALYGFPLSYKYSRRSELLDVGQRSANYYLDRLPADYVCYWDLMFTEGNDEERDSSAAAIAACGLLELSKYLPLSNDNRRRYENASLHMLKSLAEGYTTVGNPESNGILLHAVYSKPHRNGVDECCIWGDYFYFEALVRVKKDWQLYW